MLTACVWPLLDRGVHIHECSGSSRRLRALGDPGRAARAEVKLDEYIKDKGGRALLPWGSGAKRGRHPAAAFSGQSDGRGALGAPLAAAGRRPTGGLGSLPSSLQRSELLADFSAPSAAPSAATAATTAGAAVAALRRAVSGCGEVEELAAGALLSLESAARSAPQGAEAPPAAAAAAASAAGARGAHARPAPAPRPSRSADTASDSGGAASDGPGPAPGAPAWPQSRGLPPPRAAPSRLRPGAADAAAPDPRAPALDLQGSSPKPPVPARAAPAAPAAAVAAPPHAPAPAIAGGSAEPGVPAAPRAAGGVPVVVTGGATMMGQLREAQDALAGRDQLLALTRAQAVRPAPGPPLPAVPAPRCTLESVRAAAGRLRRLRRLRRCESCMCFQCISAPVRAPQAREPSQVVEGACFQRVFTFFRVLPFNTIVPAG